jgi:hypothetical protein
MKKLINLTVYDAKNMICVWNENEPDADYQQGIALEEAMRGFMVPRHYVVGVFDDGSSKAAGIFNLSDINQNGEYDDLEQLFLYDEFVYYVDILGAKAFVRLELANYGNKISEKEARDNVYKELLSSGVNIDAEARSYLIS